MDLRLTLPAELARAVAADDSPQRRAWLADLPRMVQSAWSPWVRPVGTALAP